MKDFVLIEIKTADFCERFCTLAEQYRTGEPRIGANALAYVFDDERFAHGNGNRAGNRAVGTQVTTLAALKLACPEVDIRDMSGIRRKDSRPLNKVVAKWLRRHVDPALCGADPGSGMRVGLLHESRYDTNYGGEFNDKQLRDVFLSLIDLIDSGYAGDVLRGCLYHYQRMADTRRPLRPIPPQIDGQQARRKVDAYMQVNPGERGQLIVWAVTSEADPHVAWNKDVTSNDHGQVADVNANRYSVEVMKDFIRLEKVQDVCAKARRSGACERVVLVSLQSRPFEDAAEQQDIEATIARQFKDIAVQYMTFNGYLNGMVNGVNVTWAGVCGAIARGAQNLHPVDANAWGDLFSENHIGF